MTTDLDGVRWSELHHNYGPAGDVPALLRKLKDRRRWQVAVDELDNRLYHQGGWICSASAAAAPFLIELAADRGTPGRVQILEVVGRIAGESRQADPEFVAEAWPAAWEGVLPSLIDRRARCGRAGTARTARRRRSASCSRSEISPARGPPGPCPRPTS